MAIDFNMCFNEYINSTDKINTRIISDFNSENQTREDYRGREIYEMLQNAEDAGAEAKSHIEVVIDYSDDIISIANKGGRPFSDEGFASILRANQSSKIEERLIGNKGLGFRSILNWAEEIEIHSKNIKCTFSEQIANEKWIEIQKRLEAKIGEKKTKSLVNQVNKNRKAKWPDANCPVAILPLPKYERTTKPEEYTTKITIKLHDNEEISESIIEQLESLDERVLLFLTWCKSITITGNKIENRIITCDKSKWLFYSKEGNIDEKEYSIILAYPKDESKLRYTNPLHTFFPTKINVNLPIIIHATFELTMSRNGLTENPVNYDIQEYVAEAIIDFAEQELITFYSDPSWDIYNAIDTDTNFDEIWHLKSKLDNLKKTAKVYPTINGTYEFIKNTYYYTEEFSKYVIKLKERGWQELNDMLIPGKPENLDIYNHYESVDFQSIINRLSEWITTNEDRCELIKTLKQIDTHINFNLLLDANNALLSSASKENVYINTGQIPQKLPSNFGLKFVNEDLVDYLIENIPEIRIHGQENKKRILVNYLSSICKVTTSDITSIKSELKKFSKSISDNSNLELRIQDYKELMTCIIENKDLFSDTSITNEPWMLLAEDGLFYPAYNLIIEPHNNFEGVERFKLDLTYIDVVPDDSSSCEDLFYNVLNISRYIPIIDVDFSTDKAYLAYLASKYDNEIIPYNCQRARNRIKNQTRILDVEYTSKLTLTELVIAIHKDNLINELLKGQTIIWYLRYKCQYDSYQPTDYNYAKFKLLEKFDCSKYITSEKINFAGEVVDYDIISKYDIQPTEVNFILLGLGAKDEYRNFSTDELYAILNLIYKNPRFKDGKGVQSIYKKIREALLMKNQNIDELREYNKYKDNLYLYSKTHENYFLCNELYYWDNDRLPKSILGKLPKLDIGSRVGEESVKKLFFVNIPSTKDYFLESSIINNNLQKDLDNWINNRLTFIYANCVRNVRKQDVFKNYSNKLKSLRIIVCSECMFKHEKDDMVLKMENNEIMPLEGKYYISSNYVSISECKSDPQFWNSLTEIFCLTLNISREDIYKTIREILRNDIEFSKLDIDNYLSPEEWENACKVMGTSETEYTLWRKIIGKEKFNSKRFNSNKVDYIKEQLSIDLSDIYDSEIIEVSNMTSDKKIRLYEEIMKCDENGELYESYFQQVFIEKYKRTLIELRNNSKNSYTKSLYENYKGDHEEFLNTANEYMGHWIEDVVFENKYYSDSEIKCLFQNEIDERFHFPWDGNNIVYSLSILPQYLSIMDRYHLSENDLKNNKKMCSLSFFPGHEEELEDWIICESGSIEIGDLNSKDETIVVPIIMEDKPIQLVKKTPIISNKSNYIGNTKKIISDKTKYRIGKLNEKLVYDSMIHNPNFKDIVGISKNLDPVNGNDNAHYDIIYKETYGSDCLRYLEVKTASYSDGHYSFLMSAYEYEFAKEHVDNYDVALVINHNTIKIRKSLFKDQLSPTIHTYEVCVDIDND